MKAFRTLKGFIKGTEPDEPPYFAYRANLRISGDPLNFDEIGRALGVQPSRTHRKGDRQGPRSPPFSHDLWSLSPSLSEESPLSEHIDVLWASIRHAEAYLPRVEVRREC